MENFNSLSLLTTVSKRYKSLVVLVLSAAVLSFIISFFLKEKYKSTAVVYPVNLYQHSKESNSEQLLQYLMSEEVKNQLASEFNLYRRYNIDTLTKAGGKTLFGYAFQENFTISPTLYESIEISVKDEDPKMACKINARLISLTNELIQRIKQTVVKQYMVNAEMVIKNSNNELDSLDRAVRKIRSDYDIVDENYQGRYLSKELVKGGALSESRMKQSQGLKEKGTQLKILDGKINSSLRSYSDMKMIYDKYALDAQGNVDHIIYVSKPTLPDKRCYPIRWVIVLISSMSALLLGIGVILIKNREKNSVG
ncbi:MAG: hypothetical protein JWO32_2721 [Bacteroidetes bacterium]|nr:hypothetical protein [Bacteroidota bacterium]